MKIYRNIQQGTPEWHELRLGKMTASHAQAIGNMGKGLDTYCRELAAQIFTGFIEESYTNEAMQTGIDDESLIRRLYEMEECIEVEEVGFIEYSDFAGASPDGLVGDNGGIEIKRQNFIRHNDLILGASDFDTKYIWQCQMNMLVSGRDWWDLVSYNPNFKNKSLFIKQINPDEEMQEKILKGLEKGEELIKKYLEIYNN